jgi:hypothetical protein
VRDGDGKTINGGMVEIPGKKGQFTYNRDGKKEEVEIGASERRLWPRIERLNGWKIGWRGKGGREFNWIKLYKYIYVCIIAVAEEQKGGHCASSIKNRSKGFLISPLPGTIIRQKNAGCRLFILVFFLSI